MNNRDLPISEFYVDSLEKMNLKIQNRSKWLNSVVVYTEDKLLMDTINYISFVKTIAIRSDKKTKKAKKNRNKKIKVELKQQTAENILEYGEAKNQIEMLSGHLLHNEGFMGQGMQIAVLDAGFYHVNQLAAFDSLWINNQIIGYRDFVDGDTSLFDADSHGMKVLSTMAANLPNKFVGTAPKAEYLLLRSEQGASEYLIEEHNWLAAAEYADSIGVDMITSSLGYTDFDNAAQDHSYADLDGNTTIITQGADFAASTGMLVVTSAGNEGFNSWKYISAPADADSVLTIGAVDKYGAYAYFSSIGPTADGQVKPDIVTQGLSTTVLSMSGTTELSNGTSFSAPIAAGMLACLWQARPELNNMQIIDIVQKSSTQYTNSDKFVGYGIPNFYAAYLYSNNTGFLDLDDQKIKLFPNPFSNYLNIILYNNVAFDSINLELFNITGEKVFYEQNITQQSGIYTIRSLDFLNNGIYFLKLSSAKQNLIGKVVKF